MQQKENEFYQIPKSLMAATAYTNAITGEQVKLTANAKFVYVLMKERRRYFTEKQNDYYDSVEQIAEATGLTRNTVSKIINDFENNGVIEVVRKQRQGFISKLMFQRVNELDIAGTDKPKRKRELSTGLEAPASSSAQRSSKPAADVQGVIIEPLEAPKTARDKDEVLTSLEDFEENYTPSVRNNSRKYGGSLMDQVLSHTSKQNASPRKLPNIDSIPW